jgi:hypothetical protein
MFAGLIDDAAIFPPGLMPLGEAMVAHVRHKMSAYGSLVGPIVLSESAFYEITDVVGPNDVTDVAVVAPGGPEQLRAVVDAASRREADLRAVEVGVPEGWSSIQFFESLKGVDTENVKVFIEVPRNESRSDFISGCANTPYCVKFRTGGITADVYPNEEELAAAIAAVVRVGITFKATAGLHHAIRNTDPRTGFEQHGFLNVMLAVGAALSGEPEGGLIPILAERDGARLATEMLRLELSEAVAIRSLFASFGSCSILEPLSDLVDLGLLPITLCGGADA